MPGMVDGGEEGLRTGRRRRKRFIDKRERGGREGKRTDTGEDEGDGKEKNGRKICKMRRRGGR